MRKRLLGSAVIALALALLATEFSASAQKATGTAGARSTANAIPRGVDGKPDMSGDWTNATYTPFERPAELKDKEFFTPQEAEAYAKRALERLNTQADDDIHYDNAIWQSEKNDKGLTSLRTSIVTTPDGKMPPVKTRHAARRAPGGQFDSAQNRALSERCIYWAHEGPPLLPVGYNSNLQIAQGPESFVITPEMMQSPRVVPLDARPHVGSAIRLLHGNARGWWDGDTLVAETTNFTDLTAFRGASPDLKVTERFTMLDRDTIRYQFTVEDKTTWDTAWGGEYLIKRSDEPVYEYACHEGNYGIRNILSAQRAEEAKRGR